MTSAKTMIRRSLSVAGSLFAAVILLAGCGQQSSSSSESSATSTEKTAKVAKPQSVKEASDVKSSSSAQALSSAKSEADAKAQAEKAAKASEQTKTPWDATKDQQLTAFINQWAPTMGQSYEKYDGHTPLEVSVGGSYPETLQSSTLPEPGTIGWAPQGVGSYDYNVVAIYNYNGTQPPLPNRITYVFAFHHGTPVALVDTTRDGGPRLHQTSNTQVQANFARIAGETTQADP